MNPVAAAPAYWSLGSISVSSNGVNSKLKEDLQLACYYTCLSAW